MNPYTFFWKSSIGKKWLVALTGLVLIGYVFGHLAGNLQAFAGPARLNAYAEFLHSMPGLLWVVRLFLLACVFLHIAATVKLAVENRAAKPEAYKRRAYVHATIPARTMLFSGVTVLCFIVFHILHLTLRTTDSRFRVAAEGGRLLNEHDVYTMLVLGFDPHGIGLAVSIFYLLGVGLLCVHLAHGFSSLLQTLGINSKKTMTPFTTGGRILAGLIFAGYASIPLGVWFGALTLHN